MSEVWDERSYIDRKARDARRAYLVARFYPERANEDPGPEEADAWREVVVTVLAAQA